MSCSEEYILDIKVEVNPHNLLYSPVNDIDSNCSTLTASEVEGTLSASESSFRQKKLRVRIKKLPQKVLQHYFGSKDKNESMSAPRTSSRVRTVPRKYATTQLDIAHASKPGRYVQIMDIPKNTRTSLRHTKSQNQENKSLGISKKSLNISKTTTRPSYENILNKTAPQMPTTVTNKIDAAKRDASTILVIRQPVLKNDPLNIPPLLKTEENTNSTPAVNRTLEKHTETEEVTDAEFDNEQHVIKRIYFENKSVQTKFTCNGSICGLVESDGFKLNCFYCYKVFPLHMWLDFMRHVQNQHHVEETLFTTSEYSTPEPATQKSPAGNQSNKSPLKTPEVNRTNKSPLKTPEANRTPVKLSKDLNLNASKPKTYFISSHDIKKLYIPVKKKVIEQPKTTSPKTPLTNKPLNQSNKESATPIATSNSQMKQTKDGIEKSSLIQKLQPKKITISSQLPEAKEFVDLSLDNVTSRSPSLEDLNTSYVDEVITIGDDDNNKALEDFYLSEELQENNNKKVSKTTSTKLVTLKNLKSNKNEKRSIVLPPSGNLPISKVFTSKSTSIKEKSPPKKEANKNTLQELEDYLDLSSDSEQFLSSSIEDLNASDMDELLGLNEEENQKVEDFYLSDELSENYNNISFPKPGTSTVASLPKLPPHIKNITIKRFNKSALNKTKNTSDSSPGSSTSQALLKKAYIKLPSNLSIEEVLKTLPKPTTPQNSSTPGTAKPRYFVVKKVTKPAKTNEKETTIDLSKNSDEDDMPSNDENEDEIPKPTNGCGILFGLTNRAVVIEFLIKLKTYPQLWRPHLNDASINYEESIQQLCSHLNEKFNLDIKDFEMRLSIQRVKDWYCGMLRKIYEYNQDPNNVEPYKHVFPEYFEILNKFLTSDVHYTKNLLLSKRFKETNTSGMRDYPKWMVYKPGLTVHKISSKYFDPNKPKPVPKTKPPEKKPVIKFKPTKLAEDVTTQNVIDFDADTLYEVETSDESLILPTDSKPEKKKVTRTYNGVFTCDICKRVFKRDNDLKRHYVGHFPPKYKCSTCSRMHTRKVYADKCSHMRPLRQSDFSGFAEFTQSKKTRRIGRAPKPAHYKWICEICGMSYRSMGSLNSHKNDKHLHRRLNCGVCKFTALTNYRIVQHQRKRHVVEPGTVEEIAKKCRARTDSKTPFTPEARQEFLWRREMRKKLPPGVKFHGCCKCRINFNSRKEKLIHNKLEHPIKDNTVICLLCQPEKMLFITSNTIRRHYTDMHKVPWDEIDDLVKRTKPIFKLLTTDEIEQLNSSENYTDFLNELFIRKNIILNAEFTKEESTTEIEQQLMIIQGLKDTTDINCKPEDNVYVDGIMDHDYQHDDNNAGTQEYVYHHQNEIDNNENLNAVVQNNIVIESQHIIYNEDGTIVLYQNNNQEEEIHVDDDGYPLDYESEVVGDELVEEGIVEEEFVVADAEFLEEVAYE